MKGRNKHLWILTEERPKKKVLSVILDYFAKDYCHCGSFGGSLVIIPLLDEKKCFSFTYEVYGFKCAKVDKVFIKTISGSSSFVDFLLFYQEHEPKETDVPLYAIEETKTDDRESRNTGVYQRCSKFVYIQNFYPNVKKIMLYALQVEQKKIPTETYIFGTRLLLTLGVEILGKQLDEKVFKPFSSLKEIMAFKNSMRRAPAGNVPILIKREADKIEISGRLLKNDSLSHDPNIGALSIMVAVMRKLGWNKTIEITRHGLQQRHLVSKNKFISIANQLNIAIQGLDVPQCQLPAHYWHYEIEGEKLGTIFLHLVVEYFTESYSIFENHAGCEKGYFQSPDGEHIPLAKYTDRAKYKAGDKTQIISIPDLVLLDLKECEAITIEGKKYEFRQRGIVELGSYDVFERLYLNRYYPRFRAVRTVVLYGSEKEEIAEIQVGFLLNVHGKLVLGIKAPKLFKRAINNLLSYWSDGSDESGA